MVKRKPTSKLVYSTNSDISLGNDADVEANVSSGNTAYIERDRKNRKGKVVTVVSKLSANLKELQKELQKECGAGGSLKNNCIEIQGDHREKIASILKNKGFKTKFIGG